MCKCISGRNSGLATLWLRFESHGGWAFASNLQQVANTLRAHVNSASYPRRDKKWAVPYERRVEGLVWLIGALMCLLAANRGSNYSQRRAMDGRITALRYH